MPVEIFEIEEETPTATAVPVEKSINTAPNAAPNTPVLYCCLPAYACLVTSMFLECAMRLQAECIKRRVPCFIDILGNESLVQRGRNILTKRFLASPATHLFFIDADIGFSPESVFRLLDFDRMVVTGCYPKKFLNWANVARKLDTPPVPGEPTEPVRSYGLDYNINIKGSTATAQNGFVQVLDSATGFMLIKRAVIERMYDHYKDTLFCVNDIIGDAAAIKDYVAVFDCMIDPATRRYLSEDYSFCRRWQQMGGEIWVDIVSPLCHVGGYMYGGDYKERLAAEAAAAESDLNGLD